MDLLRKKPISQYLEENKTSGLKRVLGKWSLTYMGIGAIIGAGIFVMTGLAAKEYAGPSLVISFLIAGTGCAFAALCYAEFASMLPVEGSAYAYSYATIGELFAWIIGWDLILEYAMASSTVAVGWSGYLGRLLGLFDIRFPIWLMNDLSTAKALVNNATHNGIIDKLGVQYSSLHIPEIMGMEVAVNLPALLVVLFISVVLVIGIRETARMNAVLVSVKLAVVIFVIIVGFFFVNAENWEPFIPAATLNSKGEMAYGLTGIITAAAYIFFAYIGFDAVSTQAGEALNPQKNVPFGIITSLIVCTILYILISLVVTGMVRYSELDVTAPVASAFVERGLGFSAFVISLAAVAGLASVLLVMLLAQSRIFYAMSNDGLLPASVFGVLHKTFKTPHRGTILTGIVVALIAAFTPIENIAKLVNIGTLLAFVLVCIAVWRMRVVSPDIPRSFKVKYLPLVASLGILFNLGLMFGLHWENWLRLAIWLVIGFVVYFLYGKNHSKLGMKSMVSVDKP